MKNIITALKEIFDAAIQDGQGLDGVKFVGIHDGDDQSLKDLKFPAVLIGQGPEAQGANAGNRRRLVTAPIQVNAFVAVGRRAARDALDKARDLGDRAAALLAANNRLVSTSYSSGFAHASRVTIAEPGLNNIGGNQVAQVELTLEVKYSEYPSAG